MNVLKLDIYLRVIFQAILCIRAQSFNTTEISNIHTSLLSGYDNDVRPAPLTEINVQFNLLTINDLLLRTQTLSTSGWFTLSWNDSRLAWIPSEHGNIDTIYIKDSKIWKPELIVGNVVTAISPLTGSNLVLKVKYDGSIHWDPPGMFKTHCGIDVTYFPHDKQTCAIVLTSWSYTINSIKLTPKLRKVNLGDFKMNGEWDIVESFVGIEELTENGDRFSQIVFQLTVKRKPKYYVQTVIFPVMLISILTVLVFLLPAESGEKISFGLTVLLSLAVLLTLISDKLPTTAVHTSILGVYLTVTLVLSTLSIIISVFIVRLHHRLPEDNVPAWLKTITNVVLKQCFNKRKATVDVVEEIKPREEMTNGTNNSKTTDGFIDEITAKKEEPFSFNCSDVAHMLDNFFLMVFLVVTLLMTVIFLFILAFGSD